MMPPCARTLLPFVLGLWTLGAAPVPLSAKEPSSVVARSLPATAGVRTFAETVLDAPAAKVAAVLAEAANFVPLFPAHSVEVLSSHGDRRVVSVEMRKPWPIGSVKWVEEVVSLEDPQDHAFVVERTAQPGYFRRLVSRWRVEPLADSDHERCRVTYDVSLELTRWAPDWILRRNHLGGVKDTMERLRSLILTGQVTESAHQ